MSIVGFSPNTQIVDPRTGQLTRDGFNLVQFFVQSVNGAGAVVTNEGTQTLTNKTIDGRLNSLSNIDTDSLETKTGNDEAVVTGTAGSGETLAKWNSDGDLVEGPLSSDVLTTETGLSLSGSNAMQGPLPLAQYLVAEVPDAATYTGGLIYVTDESGGATPAFSDGSSWRRTADRAVIS